MYVLREMKIKMEADFEPRGGLINCITDVRGCRRCMALYQKGSWGIREKKFDLIVRAK